MTPYHADPWLTVYQGDCREVMAQMPAESVHCVVTSPPYWGLRDYGVGGQLGLEPTPEEYVANMVAVFREVRRVLRKDGTCWVNLGDSYAQGHGGSSTEGKGITIHKANREAATQKDRPEVDVASWSNRDHTLRNVIPGLKPKDLVGIPWRVAFALQADGWYLRSDIIWSKPNPMPESVTDRPTKAHEYLFLLSKSPRYYYDADAVREPGEPWAARHPDSWATGMDGGHDTVRWSQRDPGAPTAGNGDMRSGRNLRSVWTIATQPYPGAHFATFPEKLVEPCVKAGTSERGVCPECGAPWRRETDVDYTVAGLNNASLKRKNGGELDGLTARPYETRKLKNVTTTGWQPSCAHDIIPVPAVVLDPFAGSGTTGRVAQRLGRRAVLIDLSGEYLVQAMRRNTEIPLGLEAV